MIEGRVIRGVDVNAESFRRDVARVPDPNLRVEIQAFLREVFMLNVDAPPARLHFHALKNKQVESRLQKGKKVPVYTIHVTTNSVYKASFTWEEGCAYFRRLDVHDAIDKNP